MPRWLFLFWRHNVYLRSVGWYLTVRERMKVTKGCQYRLSNGKLCRSKTRLQVHHLNHFGQPKPRYWQLLPLARWFMFERDYSDLQDLCDKHHELISRGK